MYKIILSVGAEEASKVVGRLKTCLITLPFTLPLPPACHCDCEPAFSVGLSVPHLLNMLALMTD